MAIPIRRLVVGPNSDGLAEVLYDDPAPHVVAIDPENAVFRTDIWSSNQMPYDNTDGADPTSTWPDNRFGPLPNGTSFFVMQIPPDELGNRDELHRTDTLDYVIILKGEIYIVIDCDERLLRAGDIVVQRGMAHAWSNRSGKPCTFAAIMIDAKKGASDQVK